MQRNSNSDVPFQSVTNDLLHGQFTMQMYALHQVAESLHLWWFVHVQSNNKTINVWLFMCATLDLSAFASGLVDKIDYSASCSVYINSTRSSCIQIQCYTQSHQLDRKLVRTNPMLHTEPYINYYI